MKKGFTLIELIFVIVIIGILGAVAVPKFLNLRENAEVNNMYKIVTDTAFTGPSVYQNLVGLEEKYSDDNVTLENLIQVKGKGWTYTGVQGTDHKNQGTYTFTSGTNTVATITLDTNNSVINYTIDCSQMKSAKLVRKCAKLVNESETNTTKLDTNVTLG